MLAPPFVRVPPERYGGVERVVGALCEELVARGHEVSLFACRGSRARGCRLIETAPLPAWSLGWNEEAGAEATAAVLAREDASKPFDLIHSHLGAEGVSALRDRLGDDTRLVHTVHLPADWPDAKARLVGAPGTLVALSQSQADMAAELTWTAVVPNGLRFESAMPAPAAGRPPSDDLCFVGRIDPEKGLLDAIEVARLSGRRLRVGVKIGTLPAQRAYFESVVEPAFARADVEYLGELGEAERDQVLAASYAAIVAPRWPEPFGLVTVEALALGTPVLAYPAGALPEILRHGRDGFFGRTPEELVAWLPDLASLDRAAIAAETRDRFSAARMTDRYEAVYRQVAEAAATSAPGPGR